MSIDIKTSKGMNGPESANPVDKLAATVVYGRGIHWFPDAHSISLRHSKEFPLGIRPPTNNIQRNLIEKRFGRMKVLGVAVHHNPKKKTLYVCQCDCGAYEHRHAAAINNLHNFDACHACRLIATRRRHAHWQKTGQQIDPQEYLGRPQKGAAR